jgi:hypothetical protein
VDVCRTRLPLNLSPFGIRSFEGFFHAGNGRTYHAGGCFNPNNPA